MNALIALLILVFCMVVGVPIALSFIAASGYLCLVTGAKPLSLFSYGYMNQNTIVLLTIPLFVLAGSVINKGGIGEKLVDAIQKFIKDSKAGLGTVTIVASAVFGAVTGSASATTSCIGGIMTPRLKAAGYKAGHIGALISHSGVLGIMIPPSILMILYAWGTGTSVLACFLSTIIPGIILVILFSIINAWILKHDKIYVNDIPETQAEIDKLDAMIAPKPEKTELEKQGEEATKKKKGGESAIPALLMPVLLLGSIYTGVLTATEGAAFSVAYSLAIGIFYYKKITWQVFKESMVGAGEGAGGIMVMLFTVSILSRLYITENIPNLILGVLSAISDNRILKLIMLNIFMIIIGMIMDDCSGTTLCGPLLMPVMAALDVTPIQFAAILSVNIGMGNITPPTAPLLYLGGRVADAEVKDMLGPTMKLIIFGWFPTLILTTYIPQLSLFLPHLMGYI